MTNNPRDFSQTASTNGPLPPASAIVENFRHHVEEAARREEGGIVVFVARVRDGAAPRIRFGAVAYGDRDIASAILSSLQLCRQSGAMSAETLLDFAAAVNELAVKGSE